MKKLVLPSEINGSITAPPSKSITIRALMAALLTPGESLLIAPSFCDDALWALKTIQDLGAEVERINESSNIFLKIRGGFPAKNPVSSRGFSLVCGESALTLRLLAAIVSLQPNPVCLKAIGTLRRRPVDMIEKNLSRLGIICQSQSGYPPLWIKGQIKSGSIKIESSQTSQFLSGLLFATPLLPDDSEILAINLKSTPYVDLTLQILDYFGIKVSTQKGPRNFRFLIKGNQQYKPSQIKIEGDWSGAAFFLVAGALAGKIEVLGLNPYSKQADRQILEILSMAGANFGCQDDKIIVKKSSLRFFEFNAENCPDLFPPLCILALGCKGRSRIWGVSRLKIKESDRASALITELRRVGAKITQEGEALVIEGKKPEGGMFNSHGDHRLAMAGAIAGLISDKGITINGTEAVAKSFPDFFEKLKNCGGKVQ